MKFQLINKFLKDNKLDFYLITNNDLHLNESPNLDLKDIYKLLKFDCTRGYILFFKNKFIFFTDSRYTLAAKKFFKNNCEIYDLSKTSIVDYLLSQNKNLSGILENSKKGHDYAARVFVVKKTGATPLSNRAMNYVFSSNNDINTYQSSPFTKKSIDYALSTTKENFNEWVTVKVNVKEHFKKFHDLELDEINGIAIMSDTDNSKLSSVAYYQNIYFSSG